MIQDAAHKVVWLRGMRVRESSQNTYASALHRYVKFWTDYSHKKPADILPPGAVDGVPAADVHLFLGWACSRYKYNTILSTVSALANWHREKGLHDTPFTCAATKQMLNTIKAEQGPAGMPCGKTGMTKPMLRLVLKHIHDKRQSDPEMSLLYLRDICWVLLGFFGMLRRSEIIALQMQDIEVGTAANGQAYVEMRIRRSKNDRRGEGAVVTICGRSQDGIRIADLLQEWLAHRHQLGSRASDPLFTSWDLDKRTMSSAAIRTSGALNIRLKTYLTSLKAKYPDLPVNPATYGMHSLRRGGVMAAWRANVGLEKIKAHGRWKSDAIRAYMQTTREMRLPVTASM